MRAKSERPWEEIARAGRTAPNGVPTEAPQARGTTSGSTGEPEAPGQWPPDILTAREGAALLRVSLPTFREAARRGDFPVIWVGRQARVSQRAIMRILDGGL